MIAILTKSSISVVWRGSKLSFTFYRKYQKRDTSLKALLAKLLDLSLFFV